MATLERPRRDQLALGRTGRRTTSAPAAALEAFGIEKAYLRGVWPGALLDHRAARTASPYPTGD